MLLKSNARFIYPPEEIDYLKKVSDILEEIWSVMPTDGYIGDKKVIYTDNVEEMVDNLRDLATIGENIVVED